MDIDDNDAQDQNLHIVGEGSSKVSPVLHSYPLPKFEFDDSLQGHLRFDNLVDNGALEDNHWIEEYSTAVKSPRKNVWSEATSSESVEMLLKSVGQEEKVLEESNRHSILTNVMDPKGTSESVVLGDETVDKICDDVNQEVGKIATESSVSKLEFGNPDSSQNVENANSISKNGSNNSDTIVETRTYSVEKLEVVLNVESVDKPLVEGGVAVTSGTSMVSSGNNQSEISEGIEIDNDGKTVLKACSSAEVPAEVISSKDETTESTDVNVVGAADKPKNDEGVDAVGQAESNMDVLTDAVVAVESSKKSSPGAPDGVQLPSGAVATSDITEDLPRSPILGVSLLPDDNKETAAELTSEGTSQKRASEVEKDLVSDGGEKAVHLNAGQSEQTGADESQSILDPKESMTGKDEAEHLNLAVNMPDQQQASVEVAGSSGRDTNHSSLDKPQPGSISDTKTIEPSQSAKTKHDVTKGSIHENATLSSSGTNQSLNLSKSMVSSVSSHGSQLDSIKLPEDSSVSQSPSSTLTEAKAKGKSERKPRKKPVGTETTKPKTPSKRSRKVEKSLPLTSPATGHAPVSNPKPSDTTLKSTSKLPVLNSSTSVFHQSFTDNQQLQLRAQILVYGSVLSGIAPEEPHMIAAFGQSDGGRRAWEATWHAYLERIRGHKAQPNNPGSSTPNQGVKIGSAQSKILPSISSPSVNPVIPISSPLWNIPTPSDGSQPNAMPKSNPFDPYQTPGMPNLAGHNPMWLSQGPFPGQWVASSPAASFNARLSALPITESVKLTTVKESGAPTVSSMVLSPGQTSSDPKSRKRKKVVSSHSTTSATLSTPFSTILPASTPFSTILPASTLGQPTHFTTPAALSTPVSIKSNPGNLVPTILPASTHVQLSHFDQNIVSKIEESKAQAADAAVHAAAAVNHCQNVWSQLESQKKSGLVSDDEAKLTSSAVSIAAASSIAKVAAAAAKIASNVAEQARLMADEVLLSSRTESRDQSGTTSILSAAKEAARRRIEAASAASKHAENLDAIVKAAELAAEAVSQAGKIVAIGNPMSLKELIEAGPDGYWKSSQPSSQQGHSDKQNVETVVNDKVDSGDLVKNQMIIASHEKDKSAARDRNGSNLSKTVHSSNVDPNVPQSTPGTWNDNVIKEGCLVEVRELDYKFSDAYYSMLDVERCAGQDNRFLQVRKDSDKKRSAWFAANVLTLKDGKAFVCYTELLSGDGSGKLKEWVPLEVEGTEPPRLRIAHPMTNIRSEGARKRGRTTLTDYTWCSGDRVDVWVQDCWCEAVVVEINKIDLTTLVVQFPAQGETSAVRSWQVRPTLIWKDGKWIEWSSLKGSHSSEGDTPNEKRHKSGNPVVEGKDKSKLSNNANLVESGRHQESRNIPLSSQGGSFDTIKSDLQKKQSRVVFGVPKPGKKQKFITMSTHHDDDRNNKNNTSTDSIKLVVDLMPQASSGARRIESSFKTESKEKQVAEVKPKATKTRKPPVPSVKTLTQKDKPKPSKPTSPEDLTSDEILSGQPKKTDSDPKETRVEVEDKSTSETEQPRRSVRRIQPTSRLLEGLQSSLTVAHVSPRNHNKPALKGSTNSS